MVDGGVVGTFMTPTAGARLTANVSPGTHYASSVAEMLPSGTYSWPSLEVDVPQSGLTLTMNCTLVSISGKCTGTANSGSCVSPACLPGPYSYTLTLVQNGINVTGTTSIENNLPGFGRVWGDYEIFGYVQRGILGGSIQVVLTDARYTGGERGGPNAVTGLHDPTCLKSQQLIYAPISQPRIEGSWTGTGSCSSTPGSTTLLRTGDAGVPQTIYGTFTVSPYGEIGS